MYNSTKLNGSRPNYFIMQIIAKLIVATAILFSTCFIKPATVQNEVRLIEVVGVNDGDTVTVFFVNEKRQQKIRLATIDAPEYAQPYGRKSRQHLSDLVYRKMIKLKELGRDKYGRIIGEIFLNEKNINVEQIKSGFAWHYKHHEGQQSFEERLIYSQAEKYARENRLGVWQDDNPIPPWDYRRETPRNGKKQK